MIFQGVMKVAEIDLNDARPPSDTQVPLGDFDIEALRAVKPKGW